MKTSNLPCPYPTLPVFVFSLGSCSSVFRSSLCQSEYFADFGEAFDPEHPSYWEFRQERGQLDLQATSPVEKYRFEILDRYFADRLKSGKPFSLIGVNYESTNQLESQGIGFDSPPKLVRWLTATQYPVVHLVRKNPLDCLVDQLASDTSRFAADMKSNLNATAAVGRVAEMLRLVNRFRSWLEPTRQIEFRFESLLDCHGDISRLVVHQFCGLLGIESHQVRTRRITPSTAGANRIFASELKRQLRPAFIRGGYENLFQLPKAA